MLLVIFDLTKVIFYYAFIMHQAVRNITKTHQKVKIFECTNDKITYLIYV